MSGKMILASLLLGWFPACFAAPDTELPKQTVRTLASGDIVHWGVGLLIVLAIFFCCVWGMRKLSGTPVNGAEKMRVVGGLSLGMREKIVLLQVGKKQLILGVTPGRIDTLHVLEGDECLNRTEESPPSKSMDNGFAHHLLQVMQGRSDA